MTHGAPGPGKLLHSSGPPRPTNDLRSRDSCNTTTCADPSAERDLSTTCNQPEPHGARQRHALLDIPHHLQRDEWLVGRAYISQKSMATLSDPGAEKEISLDNNDKEVELIAA